MNFEEELKALINRYSKENESNTPDFILAQYLSDCLKAYEKVIKKRNEWYNFKGLPKIEE